MTRRKITLIGAGEVTRLLALLLARRDDVELVLLTEPAGGLHAAAAVLGFEPRVKGPAPWEDAQGSDIVVALEDDDATPAQLARRCPDALLVIATADSAASAAALQDVLLWQRRRLLGLPPALTQDGPIACAAGAAQLVDHLLVDRRRILDAVVLHQGEHERQGWHTARVVVGGCGVEAFA